MQKDLGHYRKSYDKGSLHEKDVPKTPFMLFEQWFSEVDHHFPEIETNAMTLSTMDASGYPKGRVVLLKQFSSEGFVFYTNYQSEKGKA